MFRRARMSLVCLLFASVGVAQVNTGRVNGTITDNSGAVVTNATVTVTNPDTGLSQPTKTNTVGEYNYPFLPPATYNLQVDAPGFARQQQKGIALAVGQVLTLNFTLKPGAATQVVEVTGEAPLLQTDRSEIGGNVSSQEMDTLPVRDRNFASLAALVPGVSLAPNFDPTKSRSGNISVNGSEGRAVDYNVDGANDKDNVVGGLAQNFTMEGIQEFNVLTDRYSAEAGRAVGAVVNVITKSGTNRLHGSLFSEFQVSTLNATDFFTQQAGEPKPVYHRYHFGGSIGGPIKKDKLFFFGAYEHKREPGKTTADQNSVENLQLITTLNGQPFAQPVNVVPQGYFDHLVTAKVDYKMSDRQNWFIRYGRERWTAPNDQPTSGGAPIADLSEATGNTNQFHDLVIAQNYTISPNKVNSLNLHFQDFVNAILAAPTRTFSLPIAGGGATVNPLITFPDTELGQNVNVPQQTLIRKYQVRDDFSWTKGKHSMKFGVNEVYLAKLGGFFFFGANGYNAIFWDDPKTIFANPGQYPQGLSTPGAIQELTFSTGSGRTDNQKRPSSLGLYYQDDFKVTPHLTLNLGIRWDANINFLPAQLRSTADTSNRTIDILRQIIAANPASPAAADGLARARALAGDDAALRNTTADWKEFQPRIGFIWDPTGSGKMVIRGGYGIARDQIFQNLTLFSLQQANPTLYQTAIDLVDHARPGPGCTGPLCTFRFGIDPLPAAPPGVVDPACGATIPVDLDCGGFGRINDPHMTDPWAQQWSIGWQWEMHPNYTFSVDYYHVLGTHEDRVLNVNPVIASLCDSSFPGSNPGDPRCVRGADTRFFDAAFMAAGLPAGRLEQINSFTTNNRSRYDAMNVQLKKRMTHNFLLQASYVLSWSNSWGGVPVASYSGNGIAITPEFQFRPGEYGHTLFDARHRFTVSGVFNLPGGIELAPILRASSATPVDFLSNADIDGDGRKSIDRVCVGSTPTPGAASVTTAVVTPGCQQLPVDTLRGNPFYQIDLSTAKRFKIRESASLRLFWEFHNLTNHFNECSSFTNLVGSSFLEPIAGPLGGRYCSTIGTRGFGPGPSDAYRSQFGFRFEF